MTCADLDELTVFLASGNTFRFRKCEVTGESDTHVTFRYTSASDGKVKVAVFWKAEVAGVSYVVKAAP